MQLARIRNAAGIFAAALACSSPQVLGADSQEDRIKELEEKVEALTRSLETSAGAATTVDAAATEKEVEEMKEQIEALTEAVDETEGRDSKWDRLHIGGYGELHYNNLNAEDPENDKRELDFHRFVLYLGYDFTDRLRFYSELEFEHAFQDEGEWELEQAYVQYDITRNQDILGGIYLLPVGILNPTHEPTTFYGVERNDVENIIIPTTWWAGGANYQLRFGEGFTWDFGIHEGLKIPTSGSNAFRVRSGRQKTGKAVVNDGAGTTRLKYTGFPGLELGVAFQYQADASQESGDGLDSGTLVSAHAMYNYRMFTIRGLYGRWDFQGDAVKAAGANVQQGWYVEPSVKWWSNTFAPYLKDKLGFYYRYEDIPDAARAQDEFNQWEVGFNYWPHPDVVLKFDYRDRTHADASQRGKDFTGFDLGLGYTF
ncbi:MAG: porin [Pseudomonadota bacterium]|nr:porin [Pseudomonadota bacterium]